MIITIKTSPELLAATEQSKSYVMSPGEIHEQRRSFVRGMCPSNRDYDEWCNLVDRLIPPIPNRLHGAAINAEGCAI